jgi:hypothetical protein
MLPMDDGSALVVGCFGSLWTISIIIRRKTIQSNSFELKILP